MRDPCSIDECISEASLRTYTWFKWGSLGLLSLLLGFFLLIHAWKPGQGVAGADQGSLSVVLNSLQFGEWTRLEPGDGMMSTVSISGSGQPGNTVVLLQGNTTIGGTTINRDGNWSFNGPVRLLPGQHRFGARMLDPNQNVVGQSGLMSVVIPALGTVAASTRQAGKIASQTSNDQQVAVNRERNSSERTRETIDREHSTVSRRGQSDTMTDRADRAADVKRERVVNGAVQTGQRREQTVDVNRKQTISSTEQTTVARLRDESERQRASVESRRETSSASDIQTGTDERKQMTNTTVQETDISKRTTADINSESAVRKRDIEAGKQELVDRGQQESSTSDVQSRTVESNRTTRTAARQTGITTRESGDVSRQTNVVTRESDDINRETGITTHESGDVSRQTNVVKRDSGNVNRQTGITTRESVDVSRETNVVKRETQARRETLIARERSETRRVEREQNTLVILGTNRDDTGKQLPGFFGRAHPNSRLEIVKGQTVLGRIRVRADGTWRCACKLPPGEHTLIVREVNRAYVASLPKILTVPNLAPAMVFPESKKPRRTGTGRCSETLPSGKRRGDLYVVGRCETLGYIAKLLGTELATLMAYNPQVPNANRIYAGQKLNIPSTALCRTEG